MIVPVAFSVQRENEPEQFVVDLDDLIPRHTFQRIRVGVVLRDENGVERGFSALVLFDHQAAAGHEMLTLYESAPGGPPSHASVEYLRKLRDAIDELLPEEEQE